MALNFGFQVSNFKFAERDIRVLWIGLRDPNVALVDPDLDGRRASPVDYLIDFHFPVSRIRGQGDITKIIGDFSMRGAGEQVEACIGWQKRPGISLSDI